MSVLGALRRKPARMIAIAVGLGCKGVVGRYIRTPKNNLVSGLYDSLGFEKQADSDGAQVWRLSLEPSAAALTTYITLV